MSIKSYGAAAAAPQDLITKAELDAAISGIGAGVVTVSSTAPGSPTTNQVWVDTSEPGVMEFSDFGTQNPSIPSNGMKLWARLRAGRRLPAIIGPAGLDTSLQPALFANNIRMAIPTPTSGTFTAIGQAAPTITGTAVAAPVTGATAATGPNFHAGAKRVHTANASAATTNVAGYREAANSFYVSSAAGMGGFFAVIRFSPTTGMSNATKRCWAGVGNSTAAPTDVQPSSITNCIGVGYDAADTNWQIITGGTVAGNKSNTGIARPSVDTPSIYEVAIFVPPGSLQATVQFMDLFVPTVVYSTTIPAGTALPASGTALSWRAWSSVGGTSAVNGMAVFGAYIETDY